MSANHLFFSGPKIGRFPRHLILLMVVTTIILEACNLQTTATSQPDSTFTPMPSETPIPVPTDTHTPTILPTLTPTRPVCPNPYGGACLGELEPGSYTTVRFKPTLTYRVPEGWANLEDLPGNFLLQRLSDYRESEISTGSFVGVYQNVAAPDGCNERRAPDVGQSVADLTAWFQANEQLTTTDPQPVTIGGLTGVYIEVAKAPDAPGCAWELEAQYGKFVPLIIGGGTSELHHVTLSPEWKERLYILSFGDDGNVVIEVGPEGGSLPDYLAVVEPVLATFVFGQ